MGNKFKNIGVALFVLGVVLIAAGFIWVCGVGTLMVAQLIEFGPPPRGGVLTSLVGVWVTMIGLALFGVAKLMKGFP